MSDDLVSDVVKMKGEKVTNPEVKFQKRVYHRVKTGLR